MRSGCSSVGIDAGRIFRGLRRISRQYHRYGDTRGISGWIEKRYGKFRRTWLMDRGIPTEEMLEKMRERGNVHVKIFQREPVNENTFRFTFGSGTPEAGVISGEGRYLLRSNMQATRLKLSGEKLFAVKRGLNRHSRI
ncbi:MAG: hypothetical protein U0586_13000 [Candidatus Brocadiaceae bacterium]